MENFEGDKGETSILKSAQDKVQGVNSCIG